MDYRLPLGGFAVIHERAPPKTGTTSDTKHADTRAGARSAGAARVLDGPPYVFLCIVKLAHLGDS